MLGIRLGLALMAAATLLVELLLIRVFDVILSPNMSYLVVTSALFGFGLAGIYLAIRPASDQSPSKGLVVQCLLFAGAMIALRPAINWLPFDVDQILITPVTQFLAFAGMYLALIVPFFVSGLVFAATFSRYPRDIRSLYFWDLSGAALGSVILIPILPSIGPGGLLFLAAAAALMAAASFSGKKQAVVAAASVGAVLLLIPILKLPDYMDFVEHTDKRGVLTARREGRIERTVWDPVSKIDIEDRPQYGRSSGERKHVAYDGGSQSSFYYRFDGNLQALRAAIDSGASPDAHFWHGGVLASHYLKQGTAPNVLVLGSAGGQETKAALIYGASHVDAVEMVGTVVRLGETEYSDYIGNIFGHPAVQTHVTEGRSFIRAANRTYDIIQIFSNHTTSSIAAGSGAISPVYLQTVEAYLEYFTHLAPDGILHINHHVYPRMVITAARAWHQLGRTDLQRHVAIFERSGVDNIPTMLISMKPWTEDELNRVTAFLVESATDERPMELVENPVKPSESFLSSAFYSPTPPKDLLRQLDYRSGVVTDDRPYFNFLRNRFGRLEPDPSKYVNVSTAGMLNSQLRKDIIPMDQIHLFLTAGAGLFYGVLFIILPLLFSNVGRQPWSGKLPAITYFACLGAGFIILELVFIQLFMRLIGVPLYTYSVVIFTFLAAAGVGSWYSERLGVHPSSRWKLPFVGIFVSGIALLIAQAFVTDIFLAAPIVVRSLVAVVLIAPLGFFLGMPLPLGILSLENKPAGAVAWAWGINGLFTGMGGLASVLLSITIGFRGAVIIALATYALAMATFSKLATSKAGNTAA